jgi:hypothetical protein
VAWAQDPLHVGQQLLGQVQRPGQIAGLAGPVGDVAAGDEGAGVVWAQDPDSVGQQLLAQAPRPGRATALAGPGGNVAAGGEGAGVVWALPNGAGLSRYIAARLLLPADGDDQPLASAARIPGVTTPSRSCGQRNSMTAPRFAAGPGRPSFRSVG